MFEYIEEKLTLKNLINLIIALLVLGCFYLFARPFISTLNKAGNWSNEVVKQAFINGFNLEFKLASLATIGIVAFLIWLKNLFSSSRD